MVILRKLDPDRESTLAHHFVLHLEKCETGELSFCPTIVDGR